METKKLLQKAKSVAFFDKSKKFSRENIKDIIN